MTLVRLTGLPRRGRVVGELQADRQRGLLEVLRQRRGRGRPGGGPGRPPGGILVSGALWGGDALLLTLARGLEEHPPLPARRPRAPPPFFFLPGGPGDVPPGR